MLHVACAVEENYVAHSAAMLRSLIQDGGEPEVTVHYLHPPEFSQAALARLAAMVRSLGADLNAVEVPDEMSAGLPTAGFTRKATWYRIFVPDLLGSLDRVLFLDCDLLVVDSLAELWETDVTDAYVAAVTNLFMLEHVHRPGELGIPDPRSYFNAGVLLMNLELMRRDGCTQAMRDFGVEHADEDLMFRDQDALNVVLGRRRLQLHPRWNSMNSMHSFPYAPYVLGVADVAEARSRPAIRHFEGPGLNKPWHVDCPFGERELYFEHRRHTPWPEVELEGDTLRRKARRRAGRARRRLRL